MPFSQLVQADPVLAEARREYASTPPAHRRTAAQWEYDSRMAGDLFADALARVDREDFPLPRFEAGVLALAIDPFFASALLTVGSIEYQYGRVDAAMELFLTLPSLPQEEPDLVEIVDKAGNFLLDRKDLRNALHLYQAASRTRPAVAAYWTGVSYCLGRLGRKEEAVAAERRVVALEPTSAVCLNDLGWALVEAGSHAEARTVLEQAAARAPAGFDLPRNNLSELDKQIRGNRGGGKE
ncbi:MAG: tetratricopeptide repeat protein [PVC group bacterium]